MDNIKVTANQSKRTFTIRKYDKDGKIYAKYRTLRMTQQEFDSAEHWTEADWRQFLKTDEYYPVR